MQYLPLLLDSMAKKGVKKFKLAYDLCEQCMSHICRDAKVILPKSETRHEHQK